MNVSSIVVTTKPEHLQDVIADINAIDFCEIHFYNAEGKIVATIEGESIEDQMERMKKIQNIQFVYSANLSFAYSEDELVKGLEQIQDTIGTVSDKLE